MKPTWGLVPYTGAASIEMTLDHLGPMSRTVGDNALFLEVLAGADGLDPRQYAPRTARYTQALYRPVDDLRIGVMKEGFGFEDSEADVDEAVRAAAETFAGLGAAVTEISVPAHRELGMPVWVPIAVEGAYEQILKGLGNGHNWKGVYVPSLLEKLNGWQSKSNMFSEIFKLGMLCAEHMRTDHHGRYYAKAQNLSRLLRAAYDTALEEVDILLMPTSPIKGSKLPPENRTRQEDMVPGFTPIPNTAPIDCTGHPSDQHPLRDARWPAGRPDADRAAFRRIYPLPGRPRLRAGGRLEIDLARRLAGMTIAGTLTPGIRVTHNKEGTMRRRHLIAGIAAGAAAVLAVAGPLATQAKAAKDSVVIAWQVDPQSWGSEPADQSRPAIDLQDGLRPVAHAGAGPDAPGFAGDQVVPVGGRQDRDSWISGTTPTGTMARK